MCLLLGISRGIMMKMERRMYIKAEEIARLFRTTRTTVHRWFKEKKLRYYRIPGTRVVRTTLEDFTFALETPGRIKTREGFLRLIRETYEDFFNLHPERKGEICIENLKFVWETYAEKYVT